MGSFRFSAAGVLAAAVVATGVSGCTSSADGQQPAADASSLATKLPVSDVSVELSSARPALDASYQAEGKGGCPAIPEKAKKTMFGQPHVFWHHTWNSHEAAALKCTLWFGEVSPDDRSPAFHLAITRSPKLNKKAAEDGHFLFTNKHTLLRNKELDLPQKYPGYGFATENKTINWQCGPYHLWIRAEFTKRMPERVLMEDLTQLVAFHAEDLCGTITTPSPEVMNDPYAMWATYDAFGGTSPQRYGLPRPADMTPGKPRPLVTPRKRKTDQPSQSPTANKPQPSSTATKP